MCKFIGIFACCLVVAYIVACTAFVLCVDAPGPDVCLTYDQAQLKR